MSYGREQAQGGRSFPVLADPLLEPQVSHLWQAILIVLALLPPFVIAVYVGPNSAGGVLDWILPAAQGPSQTPPALDEPAPLVEQPAATVEQAAATVEPLPTPVVEALPAPPAVASPDTPAVAVLVQQPEPAVAVPEPSSTDVAVAPRVLLGELPASVMDTDGWPNDASGTAWFDSTGYVMTAKEPNRFVAVGVPLDARPSNVRMSAEFNKIDGPPGGGYGLIVRDRSALPLDGEQQAGNFLIFEVGDRGEFGVWRRVGDDWQDLVAWQANGAVHTGDQPNELSVEAVDAQLNFRVNGITVATLVDDEPGPGGLGVFLGGDFNAAVLQHLHIEALS